MNSIYKYALIAALLIISVKLIVYLTHLQITPAGVFLEILSLLLMAVPLYLAMKKRRDANLGGFMSMKQAMGTGMLFSIITGLIVGIFTYLFSAYVDHETTPLVLKKIEEHLRAANISQAEIDAELAAQKEFYSPFNQALKGGLMGVLLVGFILSFICSMFVLKNPPSTN